MYSYVVFFIKLLFNRCKFFSLSPMQKAHLLKKNHLFFEAGVLYRKQGAYLQAINCFKQITAPRQLAYCYEKLGRISEAVAIYDAYHLPKLGASLCLKHQAFKKAADFYVSFDLPAAIKLYKRLDLPFELGLCYLKQSRFTLAYDTFCQCPYASKQLAGRALLQEAGLTLYLNKDYTQAFTLFMYIQDYLSAFHCSKKLHEPDILRDLSYLLVKQSLYHQDYQAAAYFIKDYDPLKKHFFTTLPPLLHPSLLSALAEDDFFSALSLCFDTNNLTVAEKITDFWLHQPAQIA